MTRVYPRVCGETETDSQQMKYLEGLSPRVRGNLAVALLELDGRGSIPACAGKPRKGSHDGEHARVYPRVCGETLPPRSRRAPCRVYPRVCGETDTQQDVTASGAGLSPRVRGNRCKAKAPEQRVGSIPACAGKPRRAAPWMTSRRVYPRVCGETR